VKQRVITAAIGIPLLLIVLLACPPWATAVLCCALSAVGCYELIMALGGERKRMFIGMPVFSAAETAIFCFQPKNTALLGACAFLVVIYAFGVSILCYGTDKKVSFAQVMAGIFSALAISAAFSSLSLLRGVSPVLVLMPLVAAFSSDAGAYFAGRAFGKHKLAPAVSPNKTVEGCVGGFVGSVAVMALFNLVAGWAVSFHLDWALIIAAGVVGSFMGQLGDLSFSVIKREYGIKDYGKIFPGHGGVLDRFDSVIFVAPTFWLLFRLWLN